MENKGALHLFLEGGVVLNESSLEENESSQWWQSLPAWLQARAACCGRGERDPPFFPLDSAGQTEQL